MLKFEIMRRRGPPQKWPKANTKNDTYGYVISMQKALRPIGICIWYVCALMNDWKSPRKSASPVNIGSFEDEIASVRHGPGWPMGSWARAGHWAWPGPNEFEDLSTGSGRAWAEKFQIIWIGRGW